MNGNQEISCVKGVLGPSSGTSWQIMLHIYLYILETTTKLLMLFQILRLHLTGLEKILFLDLGLAVTDINKEL